MFSWWQTLVSVAWGLRRVGQARTVVMVGAERESWERDLWDAWDLWDEWVVEVVDDVDGVDFVV